MENARTVLKDAEIQPSVSNKIAFQKVRFSDVYVKEPVMLTNCLKVVALILNKQYKFADACNAIAGEENVQVSTIRQACCRAIGISAYQWNLFAKGSSEQRSTIITTLKAKYPDFTHKINEAFNINQKEPHNEI